MILILQPFQQKVEEAQGREGLNLKEICVCGFDLMKGTPVRFPGGSQSFKRIMF